MKLVQKELARAQNMMHAGSFSVDEQLAKIVWNLFDKAKNAGKLRISFKFFSIDASKKIAEQLTEWFGPDPVVVDRRTHNKGL